MQGFWAAWRSVTSEPCFVDQVGPPLQILLSSVLPLLGFETYGDCWPLRKTALVCSICPTSQPIVYNSVPVCQSCQPPPLWWRPFGSVLFGFSVQSRSFCSVIHSQRPASLWCMDTVLHPFHCAYLLRVDLGLSLLASSVLKVCFSGDNSS